MNYYNEDESVEEKSFKLEDGDGELGDDFEPLAGDDDLEDFGEEDPDSHFH